jgi:cytochrome c553
MAHIAGRLDEADISAVAAWIASRELPADMHAQPAGSVEPPLRCGVLAGDRTGT